MLICSDAPGLISISTVPSGITMEVPCPKSNDRVTTTLPGGTLSECRGWVGVKPDSEKDADASKPRDCTDKLTLRNEASSSATRFDLRPRF